MRAVALVLPWMLVGCLEAPQYACNSDAVCVLNNIQGQCDIPTSTCVYPGPECPSMLRDGHGNCVDTVGVASTDDPTADSSESMSSSSATTDDEETSTTENASTTMMSGPQTSTTGAAECETNGMDITGLGVVGASSVFDGYPPILSADGDVSSSWFSEGPKMGGGPTVYSWTLSNAHCIARIELTGNGLHSNPAFREDFGFGEVTVRVLDGASVVFEREVALDGTPDPDVMVETGGVRATRLLLEFTGHENVDCGGFSELRVTGE